jgi:hypothetical protein
MITLTQDVWAVRTPLLDNYHSVYASTFGVLEIGILGEAGHSLLFTSASELTDYLPAAGVPGPLTSDFYKHSSSASGAFGGEVVALRLNVDFSDAGFSLGDLGIPFGDLQLRSFFGSQFNLNGLTVRQFLGQANNLLGGGSSLFYSIPELYPIARELNGSFFAGLVYPFAQEHLRVVYLPGDFQEDGDVDGADLTPWKANFGMSAGATHLQGDSNADVDGADFLVWQRQFGGGVPTISAADAVPEPRALALALLATLALVRSTSLERARNVGLMTWIEGQRAARVSFGWKDGFSARPNGAIKRTGFENRRTGSKSVN